MKLINPERYQALVTEAQSAAFSGWDFSWLADRMHQEEPPWDYPSLVRAHLGTAESLLDMGTGGGEFLASQAPLPPDTHATEAFPPNQPIAIQRLSPLGVKVHCIKEGSPLPFDNGFFELVINRHDSYDPGEVGRILKPGGIFITQQVSGLDNLEINQVLEDSLSFPFIFWSLEAALIGLVDAGLRIQRAQKAVLKTRFRDIGALVYYLKAIPWQVADFSPKTHGENLERLHNFIAMQGEFITTAHRFLIIAHKEK